MAYRVTTRWGGDEPNAPIRRMREILGQLVEDDVEHCEVSLTHESEWSLGAHPGGLLGWENLEDDTPRHMNKVSHERMLELWIQLSEGNIDVIESEPWLPGYQDAP